MLDQKYLLKCVCVFEKKKEKKTFSRWRCSVSALIKTLELILIPDCAKFSSGRLLLSNVSYL